MSPFRRANAAERLTIYLNDRLAGVSAELALADRCRASNAASELGDALTLLIDQVAGDRDTINALIIGEGATVDRLKQVGAVFAERIGRLKLNGQLRGYSPLSRVVELEGLIMAAHGRATMWQQLGHLVDEHGLSVRSGLSADVCAERRAAAGAQLDILDEHLDVAHRRAFASNGA